MEPDGGSAASSAAKFCLEICAKRAVLSGAMRTYLPGSFGVGLGVSPQIAAPVIRVDPLSTEGRALVAGWIAEPECAWVHIRCPRSVFPVLHSCHILPDSESAEAFISMFKSVTGLCNNAGIPWSFEAPARSSVWEHSVMRSLDFPRAQINLCQFGHPFRAPLVLACSVSGVFDALARKCEHKHASSFQRVDASPFERKGCIALAATCIAEHLRLKPFVPSISSNQAAQVMTGLQPRKLPFRAMPEYKCVLRLGHVPRPALDAKQCLKQDLVVRGMTIPAGSKLLPPSFFQTGDRLGKASASIVDVNNTLDSRTNSDPVPQFKARAMSPKASRTPPEPPKPKRIKVMSPTTDPGPPPCLLNRDSKVLRFGSDDRDNEQEMPANTSPVSPMLLGFRTSEPGFDGRDNDHVMPADTSPVSPALLGFRTSGPADVPRVDPVSPAARSGPGVRDAREKSWTAGAHNHGSMSGLRRNTSAFPNATRAVLRHTLPRLKAKFGHVSFGALDLFCNIKTPLHADVRNAKGELNYVSPLCAFRDGEIWVEQPQGPDKLAHGDTILEGYNMPVAKGPCSFNPAHRHCTLDWEGSRIVCVCFTPDRLEALTRAEALVLSDLGFPLRSRIGVESRDPTTSLPSPAPSSMTIESSAPQAEDVAFGVYFSEAEFVREATLLGHPRSLCGCLPDHIADAVHALVSHSHHEIRSRRHRWLSKWTKRASEIRADPDPEWAIKDEAMSGVLSKKRLQLLREIIQAEGYADKDLARDIHRGFDLVGRCPSSGVLPGKLVPASLDAGSLLSCARKVQDALKATLGPSGDDAVDKELVVGPIRVGCTWSPRGSVPSFPFEAG